MNPHDEIRALLQAFQEGYLRRDLAQVETFMDLFTADAEAIGTNGIRPGEGEWYTGQEAVRALVAGDWQSWGDLRLDLENASIHPHENTGWVALLATVTQTIEAQQGYAAWLETVGKYIATSGPGAEEKVGEILRGGSNTLHELGRGESFTWPLRLTAVVVRQEQAWKFAQLHFSYPTTRFPDVRWFE